MRNVAKKLMSGGS